MVDTSVVPTAVLPKANFTAKRAAVDKMNDQSAKQLDQTKQKAPITERQISRVRAGWGRGIEETTQRPAPDA